MFKIHKTNLVTLRSADLDFKLDAGVIVASRAGFQINKQCPRAYKLVLQECISNGWIEPIATVYDWELTFTRLKND